MLFTRYGAIGCLCWGLLLLGGCGSTNLHETWKSTKGLYYTYLNPPASIDYDDAGNLNASQARLAVNMLPIDEELTRFERYMINQDRPPSQERVQDLFERFRWVNGIAALSPEGEVLVQDPPAGIKQLDFVSFAAIDSARAHDLRGDVQMTPLGPEVLLGMPIFLNSELKGYYVAHFDIRVLAYKAPDPANLIIMSPQGVLWTGETGAGEALAGKDWSKITKSSIGGRIDGYYWMCRYFGGMPLVFASPETQGSVKSQSKDTSDKPEPADSEIPEPEQASNPDEQPDETTTEQVII